MPVERRATDSVPAQTDNSPDPSENLALILAMMKLTQIQLRQAIKERGESPPREWGKVELRDRLTELMREAGESTSTKTNLREWVSQLNKASRKKQDLINFCSERLKIELSGHETIPVLQQKAMKTIYNVSIPNALDAVGFGKFASKTYGQLLREEPRYSQWVQETYLEGGKSCEIRLQRLATWLLEQNDHISEEEEPTKTEPDTVWENRMALKKDIEKNNGKGRGKPFLIAKSDGYKKASTSGAASSANATEKEELKMMKETVAALKEEINSLRGSVAANDRPRKKPTESESKVAGNEVPDTDHSFAMVADP